MTTHTCLKCGWRIDLHPQQPAPACCMQCSGPLTVQGEQLELGTQIVMEKGEQGWWGRILSPAGNGNEHTTRKADPVALAAELLEMARAG